MTITYVLFDVEVPQGQWGVLEGVKIEDAYHLIYGIYSIENHNLVLFTIKCIVFFNVKKILIT